MTARGSLGVVAVVVALACVVACGGSSSGGGGAVQGQTNASAPPYSGVDPDKPLITVIAPARGAYLDRAGQPAGEVLVEGAVQDAISGVASVTVNGQAVTLDAAGGFQVPVALTPGGNAIVVRATDLAGNEGIAVRSVMFAERYGDPLLPVPNALGVRLEEAALDSIGTAVLDDIRRQGTLHRAIMGVSQPVWRDSYSLPYVGCVASIRLDLTGMSFDPAQVAFDSRPGELIATIVLPHLIISAEADDDGRGIPWPAVTGNLSASRAEATLGLAPSVDPATGAVHLAVTRTTVILDGFRVDFSNVPGQFAALLPLSLRQPIEGALISVLSGSLPRLLERKLNDLFQPWSPSWYGRSETLVATPSAIDCDDDGCTLACAAHFSATSTIPMPAVPGVFLDPGHGLALPAFPSVSPNISIALLSNAWNQALYASWRGGFWNVRIDQQFVGALLPGTQLPFQFNTNLLSSYLGGVLPPNVPMAFETELLAQPVMTTTPGAPTVMTLVVPELHLSVLIDTGAGMTSVLDVAMHLEAGVDLTIAGGSELAVGIGGSTRFYAEVLGTTLPLHGFDLSRFLNLTVPSLLDIVARTAGPYPLGPLSPSSLVIVNNAAVTVEGGADDYIVIHGDL